MIEESQETALRDDVDAQDAPRRLVDDVVIIVIGRNVGVHAHSDSAPLVIAGAQ
jgi:hypothetical protein